MKSPTQITLEKLAVGAGAVCLGAAGLWWVSQRPVLAALRREPVAVAPTGDFYARLVLPPGETAASTWAKPAAQSHGVGWIYEVFTPPPIYYHAASRTFVLTPPTRPGEGATARRFGLELLDVRREPYRLQLVGYVGHPGDYLGAFTSPLTPETLLARTGRQFVGLGLALDGIEVQRVEVDGDSAQPAYEVAAFAMLRDEKTGARVTLDSRTRKFTDTPLAVVRLGSCPEPREVREGDVIVEAGASYTIERIQLDPPEVAVARCAADRSPPETQVLRPASAARTAKSPPVGRSVPSPAAQLAAVPAHP